VQQPQAPHLGRVEVALDGRHEVDVALARPERTERNRADEVETDDPARQEAVGEAQVTANGTVGVGGDHGRG
jgi:hypothetical protein